MPNKLLDDNVLIHGQRIACGVHGEGIPLVLIHGTPFYSRIWHQVLPRLVAAGFKVHLYDLLGFGNSERPADSSIDTSVSGQLPILLGLLDYWKLEKAHFVAHDIGGGVAQQLGIFHADRLRTLTLIDCVSFDSWPSKRTRQQMQQGLEQLMSAPDIEHRAHFREWILSATAQPEKLIKNSMDLYLDMICGPVGQASLFQHQIKHYDPVHTMKLTGQLFQLGSMPVQLIWGENDNWQVTDWAHKLQAAIPGSQLSILPQCGHLAPEDQPERLAELVIRFIAEADRE